MSRRKKIVIDFNDVDKKIDEIYKEVEHGNRVVFSEKGIEKAVMVTLSKKEKEHIEKTGYRVIRV